MLSVRRAGAAARAEVLAVHVGTVADLPYRDSTIRSAIAKHAVVSAEVTRLGLLGDEQGDRARHGGVDKAVCVFPSESYPYFGRRLGRQLELPAFGENLTTRGLSEQHACIGDILCIGGAVFEVSMPRNPCYRVGARHGDRDLVLWMERSGLTGFYLRVLRGGGLAAGDPIELVDRPYPRASVAEANRLMHHDKDDWPALISMAAVARLGASWRRAFQRRLARREVEDAAVRRDGPRVASAAGELA